MSRAFTAFGRGDFDRVQLPAPAAEAFINLALDQRGAPENAMMRVQAFHSGIVSYLVEHVGDLTHRLAEGFDSRDLAGPKIERALRRLRRGDPGFFPGETKMDYIGFDESHRLNIEHNAADKGLTVDAYTKKLTRLLADYAAAHKKLTVYTPAQYEAREAAVAIGEQDWQSATDHLRHLEEWFAIPSLWYKKVLTEYRADADGRPLPRSRM